MSEVIRMYLTSLNSFVINIIIFIIFAVIGAVFLAKGRDNLMIFFFTSAIVVFFSFFHNSKCFSFRDRKFSKMGSVLPK